MADSDNFSDQIVVKINGSEISAEVHDKILEVEVDQSVALPDMAVVTINDEDFAFANSSNGPKLWDRLEISAESSSDGSNGSSPTNADIFKGEITALEPSFEEGMVSRLVIRAYDKSHRLHRGTKTRTFVGQKDSQIAQAIAGDHGLSAQVDATSEKFDHVFQNNLTDMEFLLQRAQRIGFMAYGSEDKLYFKKAGAAPAGTGPTLTYGQELKAFYPVMSAAEQVKKVVVMGWDDVQKKPIKAEHGSSSFVFPSTQDHSDAIGGEYVRTVSDQHIVSAGDAKMMAEGLYHQLSGAMTQAQGVAYRAPNIRAGQTITIEGLSAKFNGNYFVTSATHIYNPEGLITEFEVSSNRPNTLASQLNNEPPEERWIGVVPALVTDNNDPQNMGRVKVKYPWLTEDDTSCWARVIGAGAGKERGFFHIPDVEDEVIIAFEKGDFNKPIVLGGVWNYKDKKPPSIPGAEGNVVQKVRTWTSAEGHEITIYDKHEGSDKIVIMTAGAHKIVIDKQDQKVEVITKNENKVILDDNSDTITIESKKNIKLKAQQGDVTIEGMNVNIKGQTGSKVEAPKVDVKATGVVTVSGSQVMLG